MNDTLDFHLKRNARRVPGKLFLAHGKDGITYGELDRRCTSFARYLVDRGIRRGDRVAIFLENSVEYAVAFLGALRAGAVAVPLSDQHTTRSAHGLLKNFHPCAVILREKTAESILPAIEGTGPMRAIVIANALHDIPGRAGGGSRPVSASTAAFERLSEVAGDGDGGAELDEMLPSDTALIIYTSGTTGVSKGVVLTHRNLMANAHSIIGYLRLTQDDSVMVVLPFFYSYGNSLLTTHLVAGGTLFVENGFLYPNVVLDAMIANDVTGFAGVPSTFAILLHRSNIRNLRLPRLRYVTQAGGAMSARMADELRTVLAETDIYIMYGQTEATARLTWLDPRDLERKPGSIGKPIPGVSIRIVTEDGSEAAPGEVGEIVARGDNIMAGYWNDGEETAKVLRADGLHTGDLARRDEEGYLYVVGRRSDMIKSGAHRISPLEIEEAILEFPGVGEVAVAGIPDDLLGETPHAFIVPRDGKGLDAREILLHCRRCLPPFKVPKTVSFVERLPRTVSGKVRRADLADWAKGRGQ